MMKSCEAIIVVDSVEDAIKFYSEKLGFDLVDLLTSEEGGEHVRFARLRKGKCFIQFRVPQVEEFAEFSFIKRCSSRSISIQCDMKKGIEKLYARCQKKGLKIASELKESGEHGEKSFALKDPFGIKLVFEQHPEKVVSGPVDICGVVIKQEQAKDATVLEDAMNRLKDVGIVRRVAKKLVKAKVSGLLKKKKAKK